RGQAVAFQNALDGAFAGKRSDAEALQLGEDGASPGEAVAPGQRGVGLKPAADREDGPVQFGRDAQGDVGVGPRPVVETLGACFQVAVPPLAEPDLGAVDGGTADLDRSAGEAQGNSSMTSHEFVVPGYLREAAAGGCPRR